MRLKAITLKSMDKYVVASYPDEGFYIVTEEQEPVPEGEKSPPEYKEIMMVYNNFVCLICPAQFKKDHRNFEKFINDMCDALPEKIDEVVPEKITGVSEELFLKALSVVTDPSTITDIT